MRHVHARPLHRRPPRHHSAGRMHAHNLCPGRRAIRHLDESLRGLPKRETGSGLRSNTNIEVPNPCSDAPPCSPPETTRRVGWRSREVRGAAGSRPAARPAALVRCPRRRREARAASRRAADGPPARRAKGVAWGASAQATLLPSTSVAQSDQRNASRVPRLTGRRRPKGRARRCRGRGVASAVRACAAAAKGRGQGRTSRRATAYTSRVCGFVASVGGHFEGHGPIVLY